MPFLPVHFVENPGFFCWVPPKVLKGVCVSEFKSTVAFLTMVVFL